MSQTASPKIGFVSLGCPKALVDSERIITRLRAEGFDVDDHGIADRRSHAGVMPNRAGRSTRPVACRAWWRATLNEYPGAHPVADVLTVVILMTGEVEPWLTAWSTVGGAALMGRPQLGHAMAACEISCPHSGQ